MAFLQIHTRSLLVGTLPGGTPKGLSVLMLCLTSINWDRKRENRIKFRKNFVYCCTFQELEIPAFLIIIKPFDLF